MIHTLRYEPRGQRQRFESQGQQRVERGEQDRHIHLHFHLDLTFRGKHRRSLHSNAIHMTRIFAALVAATAMYLTSLSLGHFGPVPMPPTPFLGLADPTLRLGLLIAWVATWLGGLPLLISAWRSTPRVRFLLAFPFLPILLTIFLMFVGLGSIFGVLLTVIGFPLAFMCLFYVYPFISTLLLTRAIHLATIHDSWLRSANRLSFMVVGGLLLMLLGTLLRMLSFFLIAPAVLSAWQFWLPMLGLDLAVIFATVTLFSWFLSQESMQARPKDTSPSDVDVFRERGYYPVDPNKEEEAEGGL